MKFRLDSPKMIQNSDDALEMIELATEQDDLVNEVRPG